MGGNIFKGKSQPIKREHIESTVEAYFNELKQIFPKKKRIFNKKHFGYLGSVGKKPQSGDIDFGIDVNDVVDPKSIKKTCSDWGIPYEEVMKKYELFKKRARTSTDSEVMVRAILWGIVQIVNSKAPTLYCDEKKITPSNIFGLFPQVTPEGEKLDYGVQIDWMVGNLKLLQFSYFSKAYEGKIKGLHRTQLILAMFQAVDITFAHTKGIKDRNTNEFITDDPDEIVKVLEDKYGTKIGKGIDDYHFLSDVVKKQSKAKQDKVFDIYFRILQYTKGGAIPTDLYDIWRRLHKKNNYDTRYITPEMGLLEVKTERPKGFKSYISESKPTPRLKNLKKDELIEFLERFLFDIENLDVTEKIAGQHLKAKYDSQTGVTYVAPKATTAFRPYMEFNYHRDVMDVFNKLFVRNGKDFNGAFEVVSPTVAKDFISYNVSKKYVIDLIGKLSHKDKDFLNKQSNIKFISRDEIKVKHKQSISELQRLFTKKWKQQIQDTKTLKELRELIVPEIEDALGMYIAREFKSRVANSAVEGFYIDMDGRHLKVPNKMYRELQSISVGMVNILKMSQKKVKERISNPNDRLIRDMVKFLDGNTNLKLKETQYNRLMSTYDSKRILDEFNKTGDALKMYQDIRKLAV